MYTTVRINHAGLQYEKVVKICLQDPRVRLTVIFFCLVWASSVYSLLWRSSSGQVSTWTFLCLLELSETEGVCICVCLCSSMLCYNSDHTQTALMSCLCNIFVCLWLKLEFLHSPAFATSSVSLLALLLFLSGCGSSVSPCSLSGSSRDSFCSWSPACLSPSVCCRETIPPALSPPLGIHRQHRASRATDTTTVWLFIPAALPTAESFGLELFFSAAQCSIQIILHKIYISLFLPLCPFHVLHTFTPAGNSLQLHTYPQPQCQPGSDWARQRWSGRGVGIGREGREVGYVERQSKAAILSNE